ncbi:Aldo/keto reductase [Aulographum hederae CBS 113979]|uniref:Aldo/keto reductase n=1 Tax=Aulographum hederae CBS 113979 TaxID=1176131 RepID=A0A6G1HEA7_9PEZI|nr:Aldo/keto reductase [Aulographum hederae CBS 113979]
MNPSLANFMLAKTPKRILHPSPTLNSPISLNTGATIPALGVIVPQYPFIIPKETQEAPVLHALRAGYRRIDCGVSHGSEDTAGLAIEQFLNETKGSVKREDLFISSKVQWNKDWDDAMVESALGGCLERLTVDCVDLWMLEAGERHHELQETEPHFGCHDLPSTTYAAMAALMSTNRVRAVGVANFSVPDLEQFLAKANVVPAVNQIECHPLLPQQETMDFCVEKGIHVVADRPFGGEGTPLFNEECVKRVAKKHSVGAETILLSWHVARNASVVAKSVTPAHIDANRKLVVLSEEDMEILDSISGEKTR